MQAHLDNGFHIFLEARDVIDELGLYEVGPGGYFLGQAMRSKLKGIAKGIGCRTNQQGRTTSFDFLTALEKTLMTHVGHDLNQLDTVHIVDILGRGMVAKTLVITRKAKYVVHPQGRCAQQIALDPQPISVTTGHLDHRLQAHLNQDAPGGNAGHPDDRRLVVGQVDGIYLSRSRLLRDL
jgi:hypothetical protein